VDASGDSDQELRGDSKMHSWSATCDGSEERGHAERLNPESVIGEGATESQNGPKGVPAEWNDKT
jgi:hypothetical protein